MSINALPSSILALLCFRIICTHYGDCLKEIQTIQIAGGVSRLGFRERFLWVNVFQPAEQ